jgi:chromosome segregation ATPase
MRFGQGSNRDGGLTSPTRRSISGLTAGNVYVYVCTSRWRMTTEFDLADDKKKGLEGTVSDEETAIASAEEAIAKLTEELKALAMGIEELDKSVADATEQRKTEHEDYTELMALDSQAKELLGLAKNRLNKFYNPSLYMPAPERVLTAEDRAYESVVGPPASFVQVESHTGSVVAPPPPPETFDAYAKKGQESTSVIAMVDMIVKDLDKEMTEAETDEKNAQEEYETMLADAKTKRAADAQAVTDKEGTKASVEAELEAHREAKGAAAKELAATSEYIAGLHAECDWLLQYYDVRKEARAGEVESLGKAKAVLAGSGYALVQVRE